MDFISIILLASAVSFDSLAIGVTYGLARISISTGPRLLLSLVSGVFFLTAMMIGRLIVGWFSPTVTNALGGMILVSLGIYTLWRGCQQQSSTPSKPAPKPEDGPHALYHLRIPFLGLMIHVIKEPLAADYDQSKAISLREALLLGLALALDAFAAGIGAAILGFPPLLTALAVMAASFAFVSKGLQTGRFLQRNVEHLPLRWLPGTVIIVIGVLKMIA